MSHAPPLGDKVGSSSFTNWLADYLLASCGTVVPLVTRTHDNLVGGRLYTLSWEPPETGAPNGVDATYRIVRVWTPPGHPGPYAQGCLGNWPCVFALDGNEVFDAAESGSDASLRAHVHALILASLGCVAPFVVVAVHSHEHLGRAPESLSRSPDKQWQDGTPFKWEPRYAEYGVRFLVHDAIRSVQRLFNVTRDARGLVLHGCSYRGIMAFEVHRRHPTIFGCLVLESPSFWVHDAYLLEEIRQYSGPWPTRFYAAAGSREDGEDMDHLTTRFREFLVILNEYHGGRNADKFLLLVDSRKASSEHSTRAWERRFAQAICFASRDFNRVAGHGARARAHACTTALRGGLLCATLSSLKHGLRQLQR